MSLMTRVIDKRITENFNHILERNWFLSWAQFEHQLESVHDMPE